MARAAREQPQPTQTQALHQQQQPDGDGGKHKSQSSSNSQNKVFTQADIQRLVAQGRHVYTFDGRVFDVDLNALMHPGGRGVLEAHNGRDISAAFRGSGGGAGAGAAAHLHSKGARALLERYCVGVLEGALDAGAVDAAAPAAAAPDAPEQQQQQRRRRALAAAAAAAIDEAKPLLPQVVKLDPEAYLAWVDAPSTGHPVMFANGLLERMTCTPWYVVPLLWLPVAGGLLRHAAAGLGLGAPALAAALVVGMVGWQLLEYSLHRWLFHLRPTGPKTIELHFMLHGHHHRYPMDVDRLVFPPLPAALVMALLFGLLRALTPLPWAVALLGGGILGYAVYDTTHWALHSGSPAPFVTPGLRKSHHRHHYADDTVGYGISSRLFDAVFGTLGPPQPPAGSKKTA